MPAVTQIVPEYGFPYVQTYIADNTEITDDAPSTVVADPAIGYVFAFASDRGIDNRWVLKRTQQSFVRTFGTPNFKKYGQPNLMPYVLLGDGGAKVWCMRVMPENATRAHAIVSLFYKADGEDVDVMKRKFRIKYTSRFVDPEKAKGDITKQVITKADATKVRGQLDGEKTGGVYKDGEGYTQAPGVFVLTSNGRGKGGNTFSVRIANNVAYEKNYGIKTMAYEILTTEKGLIKEAEYMGSMVTSVKYNAATCINDVLADTDDGVAPVDVDIDEEMLETVYDAYIEFCNKQHEDLEAKLEEMMTADSITFPMINGIEDVPSEKAAKVAECRDIQALMESCDESVLPELDGFDPIFGLAVGSTTNKQPFIKLVQKLTDTVDTTADDYNAADYTQSDIVSFDDVRGVRLYGGTDGYFENPRTTDIVNSKGQTEQHVWTLEEEYADAYSKAWSGSLDKRILTAKRIDADAIFDANYPFSTKCEIAKLAIARDDSIYYMDTGIRSSFGYDELSAMIKDYSQFANRLISKNVHHYYTRDPISKKRIPVTITYFLANQFWRHVVNNGAYIPFVKANCQLTGHIRNSLAPTVEDYELPLKNTLNENRFNYFETVEDNVYQRATQNTSQTADSDLLEESNVHLLYKAKRIIEKDIQARLYDFNEPEVRNRFKSYENTKFSDWNSQYVKSITIDFKANAWEIEHSILHCYVTIVYRGIFKRATVEIDINRRDYEADADN
mgnify:FL=1